MDLDISTVRVARTRADCTLRPGEAFLGGGTYLYSEPVPAGVTGLVDLTGMGWEPWSVDGSGLRVAATCTLEELVAGPGALGRASGAQADAGAAGPYRALGIVGRCVSALSLSAKVARTATVGGNLALGLPAGSMISLFATLDAEVVIWTTDGGSREAAVADLVTGAGTVDLAEGEVLREVRVPAHVLRERTAFRRASLTPNGRTAAMVTGRSGEHAPKIAVTGSVAAPRTLYSRDHAMLDRWLDRIGAPADGDAGGVGGGGGWYDDTHGSVEWRAAMTRSLAHEVLDELTGPARPSAGPVRLPAGPDGAA